MDADVRRTELDAKTVKRIWSKAIQLSKQEGFRADEWPDLQQELVVHVLEQLPKYDPRRGKREHFLASIISHKATDMLRIRRAKQRGHQVEVVSLHEQVPTAGDEQVLVEDLVAEDALQVQRGLSGRVTEEQIHCRIDVLRVEATLTVKQQDICRRLRVSSITEVAVELRMPRATLCDEIRKIRSAFRRAGLDAYL
jgi:RNA polymerase sigma-70 factor (ECF subfamily)